MGAIVGSGTGAGVAGCGVGTGLGGIAVGGDAGVGSTGSSSPEHADSSKTAVTTAAMRTALGDSNTLKVVKLFMDLSIRGSIGQI